MKRDMRGEWAVVTGASSGIGLEIAGVLASRGMHLVLVARREAELAELAKGLESRRSIRTIVHATDLAKDGAVERLAAALAEDGIDPAALVNNAGFGIHGAFDGIDHGLDDGMIDLNVKALARLTRAFAPGMRKRGFGRILLTSSIGAFMPSPSYATYCATKAFVLSYGLAVREELRASGVRVTVLYPGVTETAFHAIAGQPTEASGFKRITAMTPDEVARSAVRGMFLGKAEVIPGIANKVMILLSRFVPRTALAAMAARFMS